VVTVFEPDNEAGEIPDKMQAAPPAARRIVSVDVLRGLTILLMIYVNDLGRGAPSWMHHIQPPNADGMTLADVVFPTFLFIVGVSIPLAFERALQAGRSQAAQVLHILIRSASLLLMGVIELNHTDDRTLGNPLWGLFAFTALLLAWCAVPRERGWKRNLVVAVKALGFAGLLALLALFRREPVATEVPIWGRVDNWVWLRSGWWGILGIIGWAYLTVAILTLFLGRRREWLMGALAILILIHLALRHGGLFTRAADKPWLGPVAPVLMALGYRLDEIGKYVSLRDSLGSLAGIVMAGCLLGSILRRDGGVTAHKARISWAMTFTFGLLLAGLLTDTFAGINKIGATPTWCLWCAAIACFVWILLYLVIDVASLRGWSILVRPAGANPLVAYFLHPIVLSLVSLTGLGTTVLAYKTSPDPAVVMAGSLGMACFVCLATGLLGRLGLRVRL
jgi:heparan-alpha-glucosaminide N-acetyltransferase